jgi:hypothetical protein
MATLVHIDGFEHGVLNAGTITSGVSTVRLYSQVDLPNAGLTIESATPRIAGGRYLVADSLSSGRAPEVYYGTEHFGTTQRLIARVWLRVEDWAATSNTLVYVSYGSGGPIIVRGAVSGGNNRLEVWVGGVLQQTSGQNLSTDTWYPLDLELVTNGTTWTVNWQVNDVAQTAASVGGKSAQNVVTFELGAVSSISGWRVYFDDLQISVTNGDYPLPDAKIVGASPDGVGTHDLTGGNATFSYTDNSFTGSTNFSGTTDASAVTRIDEFPAAGTGVLTDTSFLRQTVASAITSLLPTTNYAEFTYAHGSLTETPIAVRHIAAVRAATTTACQLGIALNESGASTVASLAGDPSETAALRYWARTHATKPSGGTWTNAALQALRARVFSSDVSPNPWVAALMVEIAVPVTSGVTDPASTGGGVGAGQTGSGAKVASATGGGLGAGTAPTARVPSATGGGVGGGTTQDGAARAAAATGGGIGAGTAPSARAGGAVTGGGVGAGTSPGAAALASSGGGAAGGNAPTGNPNGVVTPGGDLERRARGGHPARHDRHLRQRRRLG